MAMALSFLNAIFVIIGGYVAITYLFPMLRDLVAAIIKDEKAVDAFLGIMNLYVIIFVIFGVVNELLLLNHPYLNYLRILVPALTIITDLIPYLKYIIAGIFLILGVSAFKKK